MSRSSSILRISRTLAAPAFLICALFAAALLAPPPTAAADRVTIVLNWLPGGAHVPIYYARDAGFYKKAGIEVEIRSSRGSREALSALGAGKAQFAITEAAELFSRRADGLKPVGVMAYFNKSPNAVLALNGSGIRRIADLAGKRIAAPRSSLPRILFPRLAGEGKINLKEVHWVSLAPAELMPALIAGKVDAVASSTMVAHQYRVAASKKGGALSVLPLADAGVNIYSLVLAAPKAFITKKPGLAKSFVRATAEGVAAALERPGAALKIFLKANPAAIRPRARAEWRVAHSLIYPLEARRSPLGRFERSRIEEMRKILTRIRNLRTVSSSIDVYSNELVPALRPRPGAL